MSDCQATRPIVEMSNYAGSEASLPGMETSNKQHCEGLKIELDGYGTSGQQFATVSQNWTIPGSCQTIGDGCLKGTGLCKPT